MTAQRSFSSNADGLIPRIDKDPNDVLDYQINWATWLGADTISTSVWFAYDANGVAVDPMISGELVMASETETTTTTTLWLSGGILDRTYTLTNRIVTAGGRTKDQSFHARMKSQ